MQRYEYDGKGQVIRSIDASGMVTETRYDNNGQTVQVSAMPSGQAQPDHHLCLRRRGPGAAGDRRRRATALRRSTAYAYDPSGLRLSTPWIRTVGADHALCYDANGNVVARTDAKGR